MKPTVQIKDVANAIRILEDRGEKVSCRSILSLTGGGMSTVVRLKAEIDKQNSLLSAAPSKEISTFLMNAILAEIGEQAHKATALIQAQLIAQENREEDLLIDMERAEVEIERLSIELTHARELSEIAKSESEKTFAVASHDIKALNERVRELETERNQLISAGESARTETAKALLQIERADQAVKKSDDQLKEVFSQRDDLVQSLQLAERQAAVSNQKVADLVESLEQLRADMQELKKENREIALRLADAQQRASHAEKIAAVTEKAHEILTKKTNLKNPKIKAVKKRVLTSIPSAIG